LSPTHANTIAIIPLRGGSRGLPGKNIRPLAGKLLYRYALDAARAAGIESTWISTDIESVLATDHGAGTRLIRRPVELATDTTTMAEVLLQLLRDPAAAGKTVVLLQATSPLRRGEHVAEALQLFERGKHEMVMSVTPADAGILKYGLVKDGSFVPVNDIHHVFANRQQLPPVFRPNGAIYVFKADWFRRNKGFSTTAIGAYVMSIDDSLDIDNASDFARCEQLLLQRQTAMQP
jgi:N-acylneuraminate cytidylyltransferase